MPPQEHLPDAAAGANDNGLSPTQTMDAGETAGLVIGRYHLLQRIGEGGMGEVWLAEQKEPVRRRVALKLVKAGMNTREVMVRWYCSVPRLAFNRTVVPRCRIALEQHPYAPSTINLRLAAIRRLAYEASD